MVESMKENKCRADLDTIFECSPQILCLLNEEGQFLKSNLFLSKVLGFKEEELLSKHFTAFVHPDDLENVITKFETLIQQKSVQLFTRFCCASGLYKCFSWQIGALPDSTFYTSATEITDFLTVQNHLTKTLTDNQHEKELIEKKHFNFSDSDDFTLADVIARDAKEIEKQNEKLYLNQRRFEGLLKSAKDIICIIGADETYKYVSPSVKQILHFEPEHFLGKKPFEFVHPEDLSRIISAFEYVVTTEDHVHVAPFRFRNAYGDWCWLDSYVTNKIDDPAILGVVINARDISTKIKDEQEKQWSAEKLRRSNERYELVTKATKDIIWDWDLENNRLTRAKGFGKILGFSSDYDNRYSTPWEEFLHPDDKEQVLESIFIATTNPDEKFWHNEYRYIRTDGSVAFIIDQGYIVRDADKKAIRMVGAMHDDTKVKENELQISEQREQLNQIAKINSHVIRKPVANILGLMDLLDKKSITGKVNLEILQLILSSTKELDEIIKQINGKALD